VRKRRSSADSLFTAGYAGVYLFDMAFSGFWEVP
jgi:hypothetical protein